MISRDSSGNSVESKYLQIMDIGRLLVSTLDFEKVMALMMRKIRDLFQAEVSSLLLVEDATGELEFQVALGPASPDLKNIRLKLGEGVAGHVAMTGQPLIVADTRRDKRHLREIDSRTNFVTRSMMVAPLMVRGKVIGVVEVINPLKGEFQNTDLDLLMTLVSFAAIAIENARYSKGLEQMVRQRTEELEQANEKLRELDSLKTEFLSSTTHELKTPLGAIKTFLILFSNGQLGSVSEMQAEVLDDCIYSVNRLLRLIEGMLDLARIEAGVAELSIGKVDVGEKLQKAVRLLRADADAKKMVLDVNNPEGFVRSDPDKLSQILINFIGNAIKYTPDGGCINVKAEIEDDFWHFSVIDTGPGMTPEQVEKLFIRFSRLEDYKRKVSGTGLGLAISKKLVEMQDGRVEVFSEPGKGSVFSFFLPVWKDPENQNSGKHIQDGGRVE